MTRDAEVYARGEVSYQDHKTIDLAGWHRVYRDRARFARHTPQIAFLDEPGGIPGPRIRTWGTRSHSLKG
jgi:hypothetical protein